MKIKQVQFSEKIKIVYETGGDRFMLESADLPSKAFKEAFHDLKQIVSAVSGFIVAVTRLDIVYLPDDDSQIKSVSIGAEMPFNAPCTGETSIKLPTIAAAEMREEYLTLVDAVVLCAIEYIKGNRAQALLNFEGESNNDL